MVSDHIASSEKQPADLDLKCFVEKDKCRFNRIGL